MKIQLIALAAASLLAAPRAEAAAPQSMLQAAPQAEPEQEPKRRFGWVTKWFRSEDKPDAAGDIAAAQQQATQSIAAYQPPPSTTAATPQLPVATAQGASPTTPLAAAPLAAAGCQTLREAGHAKDRVGQMAEAEALYRQAIDADPSSAAAINDLGLRLARQGRLDESVAAFERAIAIRPAKVLYRNNIATVLVEQGKPEAALEHLGAVSNAATAHHNLGQLLAHTGEFAGAADHLTKALEFDPKLEPAKVALAAITPRLAAAPAAPVAPVDVEDVEPVTPAEPAPPMSVPRLLPPVI